MNLVARGYAHDPAALAELARVLPLRHPSQLYEAGLEGVVLFTLLYVIRTRLRAPVGMLTGVFMIAYAALRIVGEQFRQPDVGIAFTWGLTRGQFLSLFMFVIGGAFVAYSLVTRRYQLPGMRQRRDGRGAGETRRRWWRHEAVRRRAAGRRAEPTHGSGQGAAELAGRSAVVGTAAWRAAGVGTGGVVHLRGKEGRISGGGAVSGGRAAGSAGRSGASRRRWPRCGRSAWWCWPSICPR